MRQGQTVKNLIQKNLKMKKKVELRRVHLLLTFVSQQNELRGKKFTAASLGDEKQFTVTIHCAIIQMMFSVVQIPQSSD